MLFKLSNDNVTHEQYADGEVETFSDDRPNRHPTPTDGRGRQTTHRYNADQRCTGYTDAEGASVHFVLDTYGQRTATIDALGRRTRPRRQNSCRPDKLSPSGAKEQITWLDTDKRSRIGW